MNIKQLREITGLTQKKFGERYKIPLRTIQNWETGTNTPPEYIPRLIELVMILENEIEQLRSGQLSLGAEEEQDPQQQQPQEEEKDTDSVRKEIFKTIDKYLMSDDIDLSCQDCKQNRSECKDWECEWRNYKYYEEYKKIIEEEIEK